MKKTVALMLIALALTGCAALRSADFKLMPLQVSYEW